MKRYAVSLVFAALAALPAPGWAETTPSVLPAFDLEEVAAVCGASVEDCKALVAQVISVLGTMPGIDPSVQLGLLAAAVLQAIPPGSGDALVASYGSLLAVIARATPDLQQGASILAVAQAIELGGADALAQVPVDSLGVPPRRGASPA